MAFSTAGVLPLQPCAFHSVLRPSSNCPPQCQLSTPSSSGRHSTSNLRAAQAQWAAKRSPCDSRYGVFDKVSAPARLSEISCKQQRERAAQGHDRLFRPALQSRGGDVSTRIGLSKCFHTG